MKKYMLFTLCLFLTACGTFDVRIQISPKATETPLSNATAALEPVFSPTATGSQAAADVGSTATSEVYTAISGREAHTCALTVVGAVKCWGLNNYGQLGDGTTSVSLMPVNVSALGSGVTAISVGEWYTCALTAAGAVMCWGMNHDGQLGNGTTTDSPTPVAVSGLGSGITAVKAGRSNTCVLTQAGGVKCWGLNDAGQLGNGTTINSLLPVDVSGLSSGVTAISIGASHTCALTTAGAVKCWGLNADSELGNGTTTNATTPVDVNGLGSGITAISAGVVHNCALTTAGAVKCWGSNYIGQLGIGTVANSTVLVGVSGLGSGITAISAGTADTCALTTGGTVKCWGLNADGELGNGTTIDSTTPVDVRGLGSGVTAIAAGAQSCALIAGTVIKCWGLNSMVNVNIVGQIAEIPTAEPPVAANPAVTGAPTTIVPLQPTPTSSVLQAGDSVMLAALHMSDSSRGWGVESYGHIVRTNDGGWTWANVNPYDAVFDAHSLFALNNETAWAVTARPQTDTAVWHTQDGGITWEASQPLALAEGDYSILGLQFPNAREGWLLLLSRNGALGSHVLLYKSTDGGDSWKPMNGLLESVVQSYLPDANTSMVFFDGQTGWLGGWWGQDSPNQWMVLTSNNGGLKWSPEPLALPVEGSPTCDAHPGLGMPSGVIAVEVTCTQARDPKYFYHRLFYLSTLSARAWRSWKLTGQFISVDFVNSSQGWMMLTSDIPRLNQIQYTQDGGKTWIKINDVSWKQAQFDFVNGKEGWAVVGNGFATALVHTENGGKLWVQIRPVVADR